MERLIRLYRGAGPEPLARQPDPRLPHERRAGPAPRRGHAGPDLQPDHLPEGHRGLAAVRRPVPHPGQPTTGPSSTTTGRWCCRTSTARSTSSRRSTTARGAATASSAWRSPRTWRTTRRAPIAAARHLHETIARPEPAGEDPRHGRGRPRHPADDQRGAIHQRHPHLQPGAVRRGDGGLPQRAGERARGTCRPSTAWPASSSAGSTRRWTAGSTPSARPRHSRCEARPPWPRASWPTSSSVRPSAAPGGRRSRPGAPSSSGRCGPRRPPRTRPTRTPCTSTPSSVRTRSTPCRTRRSRRSPTTARWPAPSTRTSIRPRRSGRELADVGVDMDDVAAQLEREGVSSFQKSFDELLTALQTKAGELAAGS